MNMREIINTALRGNYDVWVGEEHNPEGGSHTYEIRIEGGEDVVLYILGTLFDHSPRTRVYVRYWMPLEEVSLSDGSYSDPTDPATYRFLSELFNALGF